MDITWQGRTCFRLKGRAAAIVTDPVARKTGYSPGTAPAQIVTVSRLDLPDISAVKTVKGTPMRFDAPGYYENTGVLVSAVATRRKDGGRNVMFAYEIDGIRIIHLGLPDEPPSRTDLNDLGEIDVLLFPVGNPDSLDAKTAADLMNEIDPPVAIPMEYAAGNANGLSAVDAFLSELGVSLEPQPMLRLTRSSVPTELTVTLLEARGAG